jgi:hypothetical protein
MCIAVLLDTDCDVGEFNHDNIVIAEPLVDIERLTMSLDKAIVD